MHLIGYFNVIKYMNMDSWLYNGLIVVGNFINEMYKDILKYSIYLTGQSLYRTDISTNHLGIM